MGIFRSAGYERLVRDARLGRIHPANSFLTHEVVAKTLWVSAWMNSLAGAEVCGKAVVIVLRKGMSKGSCPFSFQ